MLPRLLIVSVCIAATGGLLRATAASEIVPESRLASLPFAIHEWRGRDDGRLDPEVERSVAADAYVLRTYWRGGPALGLYVAYYATQRSGHTIHSPLNCLPGTGWTWLDRTREQVDIGGGRAIEINRAVAQKDGSRLLLHYWYQSRDRVVASDYRNKLLLMYDAFSRHRSDGALVRVVADGNTPPDDVAAFVRALYPALVRQLPE